MISILQAMPRCESTWTFLTQDNIRFLSTLGNVVWNTRTTHMSPEEFREALADMDVCVCGWNTPRLDAYVLGKANRLKLVAYTAGSVAKVATDDMYDRGIRIVSGNEAFAQSVAEGTIAYMLASLRRLETYQQYMADTGWKPANFQTQSLLGKTVGIVGYGAISRYLVGMLRPFQVRIKLFSRHTTAEEAQAIGVEKADLEEIFSSCDIVTLHCARSPANHHLIDDRLLKTMRPGALLVNTSRGDVVDEKALAAHVCSGHIRAALDVYETEPLPMDSPLRGCEDILLQPHLGGPTMDRRPVAARLVLDDIQRFIENQPLENEIPRWRAKTMTK